MRVPRHRRLDLLGLILAGLSFAVVLPTGACLWDYDTLRQEAARFPGTLELLAGKFNRHSVAFYEWRIDDRLKKLEDDPVTLVWMDDLAVAYDKVGRTDEGIAVMRQALTLDADRYETHANLGTLLAHAGRFAEGLEHLNRAVEINPEAHFGRERWQIYLIEYVVSRLGPDGKPTLPLGLAEDEFGMSWPYPGSGFRRFLASKNLSEGWREQAIRGIEGMMRFGRHDSPILNEALGDLLMGYGENSEQRLASRAYLKAATRAHPEAIPHYRLAAEAALGSQRHSQVRRRDVELESVESEFLRETAEGEAWFDRIAADEARWIAEGVGPEGQYDARYRAGSPAVSLPTVTVAGYWWEQPWALVVLGVAGLAALCVANHLWNRHRNRRALSAPD